jgi:peptidoglycan/xylan/chitin deacetylase (PgdA/CDA1 family)
MPYSFRPRRDRFALAMAFVIAIAAYQPARTEQRGQRQGGPPQVEGAAPIGLDATEDQIKQTVGAIRAGRKLTPKSWPNNSRVAVAISFDIDNELLSRNSPLPVPMSQGEYGATTALPRILAMLDRQQIPATFYIPAVSAMLHPDMIPSIMKANRHEIGVHGWIHENLPSVGDAAHEERLLTQAIDYLTKAMGKKPVGYRAPSWAFSPYTLGQIRKAGFLYDSSMMAMDEPYELVEHGKPTGMVELPIEWILDDFPYYSGNASGSLPSPEAVLQIYKDEFDVAYEERTMVVLTTHPHISGHRSRLLQLEKLVTYMKSKPGVWFATLEQIANVVRPAGAS